ncbi:fungal hydrophobin-domain-containing protein [Cytidiella melzeri]|nr:fungal hydrophobin-domain-containing protein [Cytidiella melzeri]
MKFAVATLLALPLLAVATPTSLQARQSCDTGSIQCCQQTLVGTSSDATTLLGLLGIVIGDITGLLGIGCSPVSVVGVGSGSTCTASPVCCTDSALGGLISIGCAPITL